MWQPRGLNYPLYTVLSRHHSEANDFSLSFLRLQRDAARHAPVFVDSASSTGGGADDAAAKSPARALLRGEAPSNGEGVPETAQVTRGVSVQCRNSAASTREVLVLPHKEEAEAQATSSQSGCAVGDGAFNEAGARVPAEDPRSPAASPGEEQMRQPHKRNEQREDERGVKGRGQEEVEHQHKQQGDQRRQTRHQPQKQTQEGQGKPEEGQERQPQGQQGEEHGRQQNGEQRQQQNEGRPPAFSSDVSATSLCRSAFGGEDPASAPSRGSSAGREGRHLATSDGAQGRPRESREAYKQTTAACSFVSPPLSPPPDQPVRVSARSIRDITNASQTPNERSLCGSREYGDACVVSPAGAEISVFDVPATSAAPATFATGSGTNNETLCRVPSPRRAAVPSFRVLILFGSTSGVAAAVAFSIFHTLVHRLLSSSKLMQGGYSQERVTTPSTAAVSPTAAAPGRGAAAAARSPDALPEETASVNITVAPFSSPVAALTREHSAVSASGNPPLVVSESGDSTTTATARDRPSNFVSVEPAALSSSCTAQQNSSGERRELQEKNTADANNYLQCTAASGKETAVSEGPEDKHLRAERGELQPTRQREQHQQRERDGKAQCAPHQTQEEQGHVREERNSRRQRQRLQHRNGQQQMQQQDYRQSACAADDTSPVSGRCAISQERRFTSERREAAAQAAEVASMGLKAAAAIASAALKVGEQRDAFRRAVAAASETEGQCEEEPKTWFLDEVQIGRVGVFIQSMQYLTFDSFLEFVEESRAASAAAAAAATREAAETCAAGQVNCTAETATVVSTCVLAGAPDAPDLFRTALGEAAADPRATGCLCGDRPVKNADQRGVHGSVSVGDTPGCCIFSPPSPTAGGAAAAAGGTGGVGVSTCIPHTLVVYCISTDTGGAPPESAAPFFSEVLEAADDFRVSRGSLRGCCVAGVGCGSTDYPHSTFCRPARQLMTPLQRLGAQVLMQQPLLLLTDTSAAATTEMKLAKWRQHLMQQVECLLQTSAEEDVQRLLQDAKGSAVSSRQKQQRQQGRKQQQQRLSSYHQVDHEACDVVTGGDSTCAVKGNRPKPTANSGLSQGTGSPVVIGVFKRDGSVSQDTASDFVSLTDSSFASDSDEQSATGDSSFSDGDGHSAMGEASLLPAGKSPHSRSRRSKSSFAGVGSATCGASGEDVEDMAGGEESDEADAEHNTGSTISLPAEQQADHVELTHRRRGAQPGPDMADRVRRSQKRDIRKRTSGPGDHASAGEGRKRHHQRGGIRHVERTPEKMVKPRHAEQLSKEGYRLIGSHSAVKLCRWTKSQLRGRGGCYKHTFYGITSSQCMEMTPSLACANKCVFCWRHHKNPVGTSWRWQMDDEKFVVEEAILQHFKAIKELKGMAEVKQDRLDAARTNIRHCALSLVGEPIMYPRIAALVKLLHEKRISTFMVTNAQFPEALASLPPVTQLYLSVDAASPGDLKTIDQPLFKDYWERFTKCMDILRSKRQRTVYRLTLVAGYNMPDLATLEEAQSNLESEAHHGGRRHADTLLRPRSSDETKVCPPLPTKRATLEKAGRGSDDPTLDSSCACGNAAAGLDSSPASAADAISSPSTTPSKPLFSLNQEAETEGRWKGRSVTVERGGRRDLTGRSAAAYAALVLKGRPDFIEVKAATYAGTSKHSKITMKNIPWHEQVVAFCKDLCAALPKGEYELACAHRHSCCVLIAKTEYKKNDQWHTWIDYEKFHDLAATGRTDFAGTDYCAPTPDWATIGHIAAGFSPHEARVYTKGKQKRLQASTAMAGVCEA